MQPVTPSSTDVSCYIRIVDSSDFTPEEGVTSATPGLALWYKKGATGAETGLTESDLANDEASHSDGGIAHVNDGYYRVCLPDAAVPTSEHEVTTVGGTATDMIVLGTALVGMDVTAQIVDETWDEAMAGHAGAGTLGKYIADILTDTGTTLPATLTTIEGKIDTVDTVADAILADTGTDGVVLSTTMLQRIADYVLRRNTDNIEASSDGDALSPRSLYGAIAAAVHKVVSSGGTLTTYKSDDSTSLTTATETTDPDAEPITTIDWT